MGTSINQASPNTTGWNVVAACYDNEEIPIEQTAIEIWRAATTQEATFVHQLKSQAVQCFVDPALRGGPPVGKNRNVAKKDNTITSELARRSAAINDAGGYGTEGPVAALFRQLTNYFVARDICGHVGPEHRCKTIAEVHEFKRHIGDIVAKKIRVAEAKHQISPRQWPEAVKILLKTLIES